MELFTSVKESDMQQQNKNWILWGKKTSTTFHVNLKYNDKTSWSQHDSCDLSEVHCNSAADANTQQGVCQSGGADPVL